MNSYPYNQDFIEKQLKAGRGRGRFENYKPWLTIFDLSSQGRECTTYGTKINRQYHFLSSLERDYFETLDFNPNVIDILEQYPLLPIESTLYISELLNIPHPRWGRYFQVMTSDFVIFYKRANRIRKAVRSVKPSDKLKDNRVLEKFIIEEQWWKSNGVDDWKIITEKEINPEVVRNIRDLKGYKTLGDNWFFSGMDPKERRHLKLLLAQRLSEGSGPAGVIIENFDREVGLEGAGLRLFKHLAFHHKVDVDLTRADLGIFPGEGM